MLKVVGASWEKTRLFSLLIAFMIIMAIVAIFYCEIPAKQEDGMYAATITWSPNVGFKPEFLGQNNDPAMVPLGVARAYYRPTISTLGWASIEIETNASYPDWVQAYAAGMLEGSLCWQLIYWHWKNTIQNSCTGIEEVCNKVHKHLQKVEDDATAHANKSEMEEPFWHHLSGLEDGWNMGVERSRKNKIIQMDHEDFVWLNTLNEIRDLKIKYGQKIVGHTSQYKALSFLKYLPNTTHQFLLAHESGKSYSAMLRVHKKYKFGYHWTSAPDSELIPTKEVTFTSYPGAIHSQDDYYQIELQDGHRITVAGTGIHAYNHMLGDSGAPKKLVPIGPRAMAASRLSRSGLDWSYIVNQEGGLDIGGKQWIILDDSADSISMWLVEQTPGCSLKANVTAKFQEKGFWISIGLPYFRDTKLLFGEENVTDINLLETAKILEYSHENVTSLLSMNALLNSPNIIALGRADIIQFSKGYRQRHDGIIDIKIADVSGDLYMIAGPPYSDQVSPFRWSGSALQSIPHHGQPDVWKYTPIRPSWVW